MSSDDDQPVAKRQKTFEADGFGPIEDDKTAREKLREAGFDPDDVHTGRSDLEVPAGQGSWRNITPVTHFAYHGDLPMCRYLHHARGASILVVKDEHKTQPYPVFWFPMYAAIRKENYFVAKWLFQEGAIEDLVRYGSSPSPIKHLFELCPKSKNATCLVKWFVTQGAIQYWTQTTYHIFRLKADLSYLGDDARAHHLGWSGDLLRSTSAFRSFLLGTLPAPQYSAELLEQLLIEKTGVAEVASLLVQNTLAAGNERIVWNKLCRQPANNECLGSHPGILKQICGYIGIVKSKAELDRIEEFHDFLSSV